MKKVAYNIKNKDISKRDYIVFDLETSGIGSNASDQIIAIFGLKVRDGSIVEEFREYIKPEKELNSKISDLTKITNNMLADKENEEKAFLKFIKWIGNDLCVTHNASFDLYFIDRCYKKYGLGNFKNALIDTYALSLLLDCKGKHNLIDLSKRYCPSDDIVVCDRDVFLTHKIYDKFLEILINNGFYNLKELNKIESIV